MAVTHSGVQAGYSSGRQEGEQVSECVCGDVEEVEWRVRGSESV